ncbi:MAG: hypothetical protein PHE27_07095 [Alphaproteobacteria bacterium]|nr:hypothetical protein [Alphaproteobacteria bacterium]
MTGKQELDARQIYELPILAMNEVMDRLNTANALSDALVKGDVRSAFKQTTKIIRPPLFFGAPVALGAGAGLFWAAKALTLDAGTDGYGPFLLCAISLTGAALAASNFLKHAKYSYQDLSYVARCYKRHRLARKNAPAL